MNKYIIVLLLFLIPLSSAAHNTLEYNGADTCLACHPEAGEGFVTSIHYTWTDGETGKMQGVNDFCGAVETNEALCAKCHAGYGMTVGDFSQSQIDCLICHAPDYKKTATGPDPSIDATAAARNVSIPTREMCLRCHANAGGGDNKKRGDIEIAMGAEEVSRDLDVHMAAGMLCQDCHTFTNHHVSGLGMDMRVADTDIIVSCDNCHGLEPHENEKTNDHTDKVYCTTCHIKSYGKEHVAETERNWENGKLNQFEDNPAPIQVWWNRESYVMDITDKPVFDDGRVVMAEPMGDINDQNSMIYAAREHLGRQPWDGENMLSFVVMTKKGGGTMTDAVYDSTGVLYDPLQYVDAKRYLGIFHGVSPAEDAYTCRECHREGAIDFAGLGYEVIGNKTTIPNDDLDLVDFSSEAVEIEPHKSIWEILGFE